MIWRRVKTESIIHTTHCNTGVSRVVFDNEVDIKIYNLHQVLRFLNIFIVCKLFMYIFINIV